MTWSPMLRSINALALLVLLNTFSWAIASDQPKALTPPSSVREADIIERLRPQEPVPRTRSMRNLTVDKREVPQLDLAIPFEINSDRLTTQGAEIVETLRRALQSDALNSYRFQLVGHTDQSGAASLNQLLSERRANRVLQELVRQGINPNRLQSEGRGWSQLIPQFPPTAPEHRRVTVMTLTE